MCNKPDTYYCPRQQEKHKRYREYAEADIRAGGPGYVPVRGKPGHYKVWDCRERCWCKPFTMDFHRSACSAKKHWNPEATRLLPN